MSFINTPLIDNGFRGEIKEVSLVNCQYDIGVYADFSRITDGIDKYITGIGTALSGLKSLAVGKDSSFMDAMLLDGEFPLDVSIPAQFEVKTDAGKLTIPATTWILTKTAELKIGTNGYSIDASNMLAVAAFDRSGVDECPDDGFFVSQAETLFGIQYSAYAVFTRAANLVSIMRNNNHGNSVKARIVAQVPAKK